MNLLGMLDIFLIVSTIIATGFLLSVGDALGWGGIMAVTPWFAQILASFITNQRVVPVRFKPLGDNTVSWRLTDMGIMVLWLVLAGLTTTAFVTTSLLVMFEISISFDPWLITSFGVVVAMMLRVGIPLILIGIKSCKDVLTGAPPRQAGMFK